MILLAIDTSTTTSALALLLADGATTTIAGDPSQRHGRGLVAAIGGLLSSNGLTPRDVDAFAVGLGPGSYTGLRVGLTAMKVMAYAVGRPLSGLDSLEAIARNAPADALRVSAIADAQRGEFYAADFSRTESGGPLARLGPTRIEPASAWIAGLEEGDFAIGPGLARLGSPLPAMIRMAEPASCHPSGEGLIALARENFMLGKADDPWFLEPLYLRRSAAEDQWDARSRTS